MECIYSIHTRVDAAALRWYTSIHMATARASGENWSLTAETVGDRVAFEFRDGKKAYRHTGLWSRLRNRHIRKPTATAWRFGRTAAGHEIVVDIAGGRVRVELRVRAAAKEGWRVKRVCEGPVDYAT